jgi:hypothetical protein
MPTTPNFAIPYPCSGDTIDPTVIADWANGIDAALATVSDTANLALNRPSLYATSPLLGQSYATGVAADISFSLVNFNVGVTMVTPTTTATITRAGVYRISGQINHINSVTTMTRYRVIINSSTGRRVSRNLNLIFAGGTNQVPLLAEGLFVCPVGTTITLNFQWIGTGGPLTAFGLLWLNMVSEL